jgi:predicted porin
MEGCSARSSCRSTVHQTLVASKGWDVISRSSRVGVKGKEALGNGLNAIDQISLLIPMANPNLWQT